MDDPRLVHQISHTQPADTSASCPFCLIAATYGPISPSSAPGSPLLDPEKLEPPSHVLFSTEDVIAFLDIMPLVRGHVLVAPRKHRIKVGDLSPNECAEIGRVLPMLARCVTRAVMPDIPHEQADYNIVQNNGPGAAQVVPHVHFHIVPRAPLNYTPPSDNSHTRIYPPSAQPPASRRWATLFGRGRREDLDNDEAAVLVEQMRRNIKEEWERSGRNGNAKF